MRCFGSVSELRAALKREGARGGGLGEQGVAAPLAAAHSGGAGVPGAAAEADAGPRGLANKEPMRIGILLNTRLGAWPLLLRRFKWNLLSSPGTGFNVLV